MNVSLIYAYDNAFFEKGVNIVNNKLIRCQGKCLNRRIAQEIIYEIFVQESQSEPTSKIDQSYCRVPIRQRLFSQNIKRPDEKQCS